MQDPAKRKYNQAYVYTDPKNYIPFAFHCNEHTIVTKNGELIQTIQVNGLNSEIISENLLELRAIIRTALLKHLDTSDIACWIQTVRNKVNLDSASSYDDANLLSYNIHRIWAEKNYWNDKYVNTLYISFVYKAADLKVKNLTSFINSLFNKTLSSFYINYIDKVINILESIVNNVTEELREFGVQRMSLYIKEDRVYSELLQVFARIVHLKDQPVEIKEVDLSLLINADSYGLRSNQIEITSRDSRKYASILSIKEYQEVSTKALDKFLQLPIEFIITEVFYFIEQKQAKNYTDFQSYILKVSGDKDLERYKGITKMLEVESKYKYPYCHQQIAILVVNSNPEDLMDDIGRASYHLANIGIIHVLEDVDIENVFWSQLPGNFKFLRRLTPISIANIASMASLHNFPAGRQFNPWGNAISILRTEAGTPYFFNFHNASGNSHVLIAGSKNSGKTVLTNFLISESMKFQHELLYLTISNDSEVFICSQAGKWFEDYLAVDPFKLNAVKGDEDFIFEILKTMTGHHIQPLKDQDLEVLKRIKDFLLSLPTEQLNFSKLNEFDYVAEKGEHIRSRIIEYLPEGKYHKYFTIDNQENANWELTLKRISAFNFKSIIAELVEQEEQIQNDKKLLLKFKEAARVNLSMRELLVSTYILKYLEINQDQKKIIVLDNLTEILAGNKDLGLYSKVISQLDDNNVVLISNITLDSENEFFKGSCWEIINKLCETKIYLPAETMERVWQQVLKLNEVEFRKLKSMTPTSRLFIVKQDNLSTTIELSLGGLSNILKILSANEDLRAQCHKFIQEKGEDPSEWLIELYDKL